MGDITKFYPRNAAENPDVVLEKAIGQFSQVVVIGIDPYGVIGVCASLGLSDEKVIYLMERFKHDLLSLSAREDLP